jgi:hypothetical protein
MALIPLYPDEERTMKTCLHCRQPFTSLDVIREPHGHGRAFQHSCGIIYTPEFVRDHYGIEAPDAPAVVVADPADTGR